jgi:hypothetical protein
MTAYELYLLLHVTAAIAWVGAAFLMVVLMTRASCAHASSRAVALAGDSEWLGLRLYLPANAVVLVSALLLVREGPWTLDMLWIGLGIAGFALSFAIGATVFGPGWARVGKLAHDEGADSPSVRARLQRLIVVSWLDLGILLAVVFVMVVKPTGDERATVALALAIPVCVTAMGLLLLRTERRKRPEAPAAAGTR